MEREEKITHPSFATISISRVNGNSGYLFGSEIQPNHYIQIEIHQAEGIRDLYDDKITEKSILPICRVKMSPAQFSELITTFNHSPGTPCTLEMIRGDGVVPQVNTDEVESRKTFVNRKFKERMLEFAKDLAEKDDEARALIRKKTLSKNDQEKLIKLLNRIVCEVTENIPFFEQCFQKYMEKIIIDAKTEIDASIQHMITQAGIKALRAEGTNPFREIEQ